jgi:GNAT superfamily N-acetyltransferase
MEPLDYLHLQMRLEGNEVIDGRFIRQVETVPGEGVPLMLIAELADQTRLAYYDEATSSHLQTHLAASLEEFAFSNIDLLLNALNRQGIAFEVSRYKTYIFPAAPVHDRDVSLLPRHDSKVREFGFDRFAEQVYAIEREGRIVSACVSARENQACGEAWVMTLARYRNQGLAQKVLKAWGASLIETGKVPFYSHKIENTASANLARKLGLQPVFEEIVISSK